MSGTAGSERRIRAVLFDVDGTLYAQTPLRIAMACELGVAHVAALCRAERPTTRLVAEFRRAREGLRSPARDHDPLEARQYLAVAERLACAPEQVEHAVEEWIYRRPLKWLRYCRRPDLVAFLSFLSARGVHRGVFSDYPAGDKLAALGIASWFDLVLAATDPEIGALKPEPRGFLAAAERWRLQPGEILYVGDRPDVDGEGATAAGMRCALLTGGRRVVVAGEDAIAVGGFKELQRVLDPVC